MSLRILFADDSMTAQNMGKKILSEAGYDVVAVSNGAAAVKKIAEQKPDIIILDVYMPGYSGLEVCEKVRGSLDTVKTPVLLTVGKMEPYKPEDANRVKADGVIIKPFEASDLLAIVKKFEERIALLPPPPIVAQTVRPERHYKEEDEAPEPVEHRSSSNKGSMQPMVEVPDHMASSSAFSDLLGPDSSSTHHFAVNTPAAAFETSVIVPAPPVPSAYDEPLSAEEETQVEPISAVETESASEIIATPVVAAPEPIEEAAIPEPELHAVPVEEVAQEPPHPQFIPIFKEPEPEPQPEPAAYEMVPTAAPPTGEIEIPREPELQETAEETTRNTVADKVEPGLLSPIAQQMETHAPPAEPTTASVDMSPADAPIEVSPATMEVTPAESYSEPLPTIEPPPIEQHSVEQSSVEPLSIESSPVEQPREAATAEVSDSDFEARVAAAMAAYNNAEAVAAPASVTESSVAVAAEAAPVDKVYAAQAFEVAHTVAEPAQSFEYHPSAGVSGPATHTAPASAEFITEPALAPSAPIPPAPEPIEAETAVVHNAIATGVEAAAVAAVAETGTDHHNIAQAIHRVMERLKPELVEEIMRELKPRK
ncbi:MAG TPA: response regulator [Candidatus Angelobacter sp.]|nr:response regulator [Candidatus Angelobacter sp.]